MTEAEFPELMLLLDSLWGQGDEIYEAGFMFLLGDEPFELVKAAVQEIAVDDKRDSTWMPKPPELKVRVEWLKRRRRHEARMLAQLGRVQRLNMEHDHLEQLRAGMEQIKAEGLSDER